MVSIDQILASSDLPWDRGGLSWNKGMTVALKRRLDEVLTNATGEWEWESLSIVIPMDNVLSHPRLPWSKYRLSVNRTMTLDAKVALDMVTSSRIWSWYALSRRIHVDDILAHPDLP